MKKLTYTVLICSLFVTNAFAEELPDSVKKMIPELQQLGKNSILVSEVKKHNELRLNINSIKIMDKEWIATSGLNKKMIALLNNGAARELKAHEKKNPNISESFVMGMRGANVAMTNKTSDYWQGDEDKFTKTYNNGSGATHIGKLKFDESSQAYLVQISVPVIDKSKVIGAITFGINVD